MADEHTAPAGKTEIDEAIHALRNGMNALTMNAAVLAMRADEFPEALRPFVERIAQSGKRCSDELARLYALIDAART